MKIDLREIVKRIYAILIVVGMPLWFHNGYFDMIEAKGNYFTSITLICIFIFTISFLIFILFYDSSIDIKLNIVDFIVVIFLVNVIVGTLLSNDAITTLLGDDGWGLGTIFIILCILMFYLFSIFMNDVKNIINLIFLVANVVFILGILNSLGFDPLLIMYKLQTQDVGKYLSTIGNINWYGEYCCLIVPMAVVYIINYRRQNTENKLSSNIKKHTSSILYCITFVLGMFSSVTSNSDCALIGIIVSFIYLIWHIIKPKSICTARISSICIIVMAIILVVIKVLDNKKYFLCPLEELQNLLISIYAIIFLLFIGVTGYISTVIKIKKCYFILTIIIISIMLFIWSVKGSMMEGLENYLTFNDSWGTNRGYIWRYAIKIYSRLGLQEKLFGNGLDSFGTLARGMYPIELYTYFGKNLINAHNNALQLLITTGIIGAITYYAGGVIAIVRGIRSKKVESIAISLSLYTYLVQGLVNNFQPLGLVMSLMLFALLNNTIKT